MPQMSPLNWLMLFFYFTMIFMLMNTLIYPLFLYSINSTLSMKLKNISPSWKW
uniref:ATP synthase F0 subunit 8 n=1 Tax=Ctenisodes sp. 1 EF-2015 TaxID=1756872 RepID=A0A0S2M750_9COLE|nr:ATP synthase F0 subunit 8 [Ctenisodes sp. 1 EF-2015]